MKLTIIDPLYGARELSAFLSTLICQPEIQRLRDIRLSNINSLLLPGSSNISRFEHSVGTAILGQVLADRLQLSPRDTNVLTCAALLHDAAITPFGHLMEEAYRYAGFEYDHERILEDIFLGRRDLGGQNFQIYKGREVGFRKVLGSTEYRQLGISPDDVFEVKQGRGRLGWLINGTLDLDNLDNVLRLSFHLGLRFDRDLPFDLLEGFVRVGDKIYFRRERLERIQEWLRIRTQQYQILMTNRTDFAAKAMLVEAIVVGLRGSPGHIPVFDERSWNLTDQELWSILQAYAPAAPIMERLALGDVYQVPGFFWARSKMLMGSVSARTFNPKIMEDLRGIGEAAFELPVSVYAIPDKRARRIDNYPIISSAGTFDEQPIVLGEHSDLVLLGFCCARREQVPRRSVENVRKELCKYLHLSCADVWECDPQEALVDVGLGAAWPDKRSGLFW